jgi:hypothetical protein
VAIIRRSAQSTLQTPLIERRYQGIADLIFQNPDFPSDRQKSHCPLS